MSWLTTPIRMKRWHVAVVLVAAAASAFVFLPAEALLSGDGAAPGKADRLAREYAEAHAQGKWPEAIQVSLKLNELVPGNSEHQYNLACAYARNTEPDKAAVWLTKAAANGFSLLRFFKNDPDLANLRPHAGYKAALSIVKKNREGELAALKAKFEQTPMHVVLPPAYDKDQAAPRIVALHGKGARAPGIAEGWRNVAAEMGAVLIAPQAVIPMGPGFSWNNADTNDSLCDNAEFLVRLTVEFAMDNYRIDKERTVLTGFSEGGFMSQMVGPRPPYLFTGVIPMGCGYLREFDEPSKAVGDRPPRFYFMAGERDRAVPAVQLRLAAKDYVAAGFRSKVRIYPKVAHAFPINRDEELRTALDFVLRR